VPGAGTPFGRETPRGRAGNPGGVGMPAPIVSSGAEWAADGLAPEPAASAGPLDIRSIATTRAVAPPTRASHASGQASLRNLCRPPRRPDPGLPIVLSMRMDTFAPPSSEACESSPNQ
jgi:hypothetical protein